MRPFQLLMAIITLFLTGPHVSAEPAADDTQYLIMVADLTHPEILNSGKIYISINGEEYREERAPYKQAKGNYNYNYLIHLIREFNREGWELLNGDLSVITEKDRQRGHIFIMMTRKNPYGIDRTPIDTIYQGSPIRGNVPQRQ